MPSLEFIEELGQTPPRELAEIITRYVREVHPKNMPEAAKIISDAAYRAVPDVDNGVASPRLLPVAEFMAAVGEPLPSLVASILPYKKLTVLSGNAKEGKSLIALEILHCVATGRDLMGKYPVEKPGPVAYLGLEDGEHEIMERLRQRGMLDHPGFYVCPDSFDMFTPSGFATFQSLISSMPTSPVLVVIDTAREAYQTIGDWNDASQVIQAISPLRRWSHQNCTVILVTHNNKNSLASGVNKIAGSGALVSSSDCYMLLENKIVLENGDLRWEWEMGGRGLKQSKHFIEMDTKTLHIRALDKDESRAAKTQATKEAREECKSAIAMHLHDHGEATIAQTAQAIDASTEFVRATVKEMLKDGHISKTGRKIKLPGAGAPSESYDLTTKGKELFIYSYYPMCGAQNNNSDDNDVPQNDLANSPSVTDTGAPVSSSPLFDLNDGDREMRKV